LQYYRNSDSARMGTPDLEVQVKKPQTTQVINLTIPPDFIATIQAEEVGLLRRLSEIAGMRALFQQYAMDLVVGTPIVPDVEEKRRPGRPAANKNGQQQPSGGKAAKVAKAASGERPTPETVVLEALDSLPGGATFLQVTDWVKGRYPQFTYQPNHLRIALNRAWEHRKISASGAIVTGVQFPGKYCSLKHMIANAVMAPEKTAKTPKRQRRAA
jgi:hypothetical protein